jgi:hypothetical protein
MNDALNEQYDKQPHYCYRRRKVESKVRATHLIHEGILSLLPDRIGLVRIDARPHLLVRGTALGLLLGRLALGRTDRKQQDIEEAAAALYTRQLTNPNPSQHGRLLEKELKRWKRP